MAQALTERPAKGSGVLLVEDDLLIAYDVADMVRALGFRIIGPAMSEQQALMLAETDRPDVLLTDINLGAGGSGIALARKLSDRFGRIPVLFLTAYDPRHLADDVVGINTVGWISKPCMATDIGGALDQVMGELSAKAAPG